MIIKSNKSIRENRIKRVFSITLVEKYLWIPAENARDAISFESSSLPNTEGGKKKSRVAKISFILYFIDWNVFFKQNQ